MHNNKKPLPPVGREATAMPSDQYQYTQDVPKAQAPANEYTVMRKSAGMSMDDVVPKMRLLFPRFSKPALSFVENANESGVTFTDTADVNFRRLTGAPPKRAQTKRSENRTNPCRWQVRLTEAQSELLNRRMARLDYSTKQTYLEALLRVEIAKEAEYEAVARRAKN